MKNFFSSSEIIGTFTRDGREFEVCATADTDFDEETLKLLIELDSFVRPVNIRAREKCRPADWLPKKLCLKETASRDEAVDLAKEVFHRWIGKVRKSIPLPIHNN